MFNMFLNTKNKNIFVYFVRAKNIYSYFNNLLMIFPTIKLFSKLYLKTGLFYPVFKNAVLNKQSCNNTQSGNEIIRK